MTLKTLGQVGYEAYCAKTDWKSLVSGQPLPQWENLTPVIRQAWEESSAKVQCCVLGAMGPSSPLTSEIEQAINRNSAESVSNTPDFILAAFLSDCLKAFNRAVVARKNWYEPAQPEPTPSQPEPKPKKAE